MKFDKEPKTGGGEYVSLKDGDAIQGVLAGDPLEFYCKWVGEGQERRMLDCEEGMPGAKFRFKINFITKDAQGNYVAKILEQGPKMYGDFKELNQDYDLEETVLKIKRKGSGLNTEYTVLPMPKKLNETEKAYITSVELFDLKAKHEESIKDHKERGKQSDVPAWDSDQMPDF